MTYIRSDDGATMIEIGPHSYANRDTLARSGWMLAARTNDRDEEHSGTNEPETPAT